jgi:hypothetical protein
MVLGLPNRVRTSTSLKRWVRTGANPWAARLVDPRYFGDYLIEVPQAG